MLALLTAVLIYQSAPIVDQTDFFSLYPNIVGFTAYRDGAFFGAQDGHIGYELYYTDGTTAGTHALADIAPGIENGLDEIGAATANGFVFAANDGLHGSELWISDGTSAGTRLLRDLRPGSRGSDPAFFHTLGDRVFFATRDSYTGWGSSGSGFTHYRITYALWVTDGTADGTTRLTTLLEGTGNHILSGVGALGDDGETVTYALPSGMRDDFELNTIPNAVLISDGTAAGTRVAGEIYDPFVGPSIDRVLYHRGRVFLVRQEGMAPTATLTTPSIDGRETVVAHFPGRSAFSGPDGLYVDLSRQDGGLALVHDDGGLEVLEQAPTKPHYALWGRFQGHSIFEDTFNGGSGLYLSELDKGRFTQFLPSGHLSADFLGAFADRFWFTTFRITPSGNRNFAIWESEGTPETTHLLHNLGRDMLSRTELVGEVLFALEARVPLSWNLVTGDRVYLADFTANAAPRGLVVSGDRLFFQAPLGTENRSGWRLAATGTAGGALQSLIALTLPGVRPPTSIIAGDRTALAINQDLYLTDGTPEGSQRFVRWSQTFDTPFHLPYTSGPRNLTALGEDIYFTEAFYAGTESKIWRFDAERDRDSLTYLERNIPWNADIDPHDHDRFLGPMVAFDGQVFFSHRYRHTETLSVVDESIEDQTGGTEPQKLRVIETFEEGRIVAMLTGPDVVWLLHVGARGVGLYRFDGEALSEVFTIDNLVSARGLAFHGDRLRFIIGVHDGSEHVMLSDGTAAGSYAVASFYGSASPMIDEVLSAGRYLYMTAWQPETGWELWRASTRINSLKLYADIFPGPISGRPRELTLHRRGIYFSARTEDAGRELMVTAGVQGGARVVEDLQPGPDASFPQSLVSNGDRLFYIAKTEQGPTVLALTEPSTPRVPRFKRSEERQPCGDRRSP